jgi:hypothetical protein
MLLKIWETRSAAIAGFFAFHGRPVAGFIGE